MDIVNEWRRGRDFFRAERALRALRAYGRAAEGVLPRLQKVTRDIAMKESKKQLEEPEKRIAPIEADPSPKPVRSLQDFIEDPTEAKEPSTVQIHRT